MQTQQTQVVTNSSTSPSPWKTNSSWQTTAQRPDNLTQLARQENSIQPDNLIQFPISTPTPSTLPTPSTPTPTTHSHPKSPQQRVSPIRDPEKVNQIYQTLLTSGRYGLRNATIFLLQLSIGRRTNDIANMRLCEIFDFKKGKVKSTITVDEHKTGKTARDLPINSKLREKLLEYILTLKYIAPDALLFPSQKVNKDGSQRGLNTSTLDNIYQKYTCKCFEEGDEMTHISSYAARKTYGYDIYSECMKKHNGLLPGTDISALQYVQSVFNHNSSMTTLRYIGAYDKVAEDLVEDIAGKYEF